MTETIQSLSGKIRISDHFRGVFFNRPIFKLAIIFPPIIFLMLILIGFWKEGSLTNKVVSEAIYTSIIVIVMVTSWSVLLSAMSYRRLAPEQLNIFWTFSVTGFSITDGAGSKVVKPWSQLSAVRYSKKGVCFYCKPRGSFWMPVRLLSNEQLKELRILTSGLGL